MISGEIGPGKLSVRIGGSTMEASGSVSSIRQLLSLLEDGLTLSFEPPRAPTAESAGPVLCNRCSHPFKNRRGLAMHTAKIHKREIRTGSPQAATR